MPTCYIRNWSEEIYKHIWKQSVHFHRVLQKNLYPADPQSAAYLTISQQRKRNLSLSHFRDDREERTCSWSGSPSASSDYGTTRVATPFFLCVRRNTAAECRRPRVTGDASTCVWGKITDTTWEESQELSLFQSQKLSFWTNRSALLGRVPPPTNYKTIY